MSYDGSAFRQGVSPGGMFDKNDVRLLILSVLSDCGRPVPENVLVGGLFGGGLANYFELSAAVEDLLEKGLLSVAERTETGEKLAVTRQGRETAEALARDLPKNTRQKAVESIGYFELAEKRRRENSVEAKKTADGGFAVTLSAGTPEDPLMDLTVYVPSRELADEIRKKMSDAPEKLCEKIFGVLLEEKRAGSPDVN